MRSAGRGCQHSQSTTLSFGDSLERRAPYER
jgi:hypothetical protein